MLLVLFSWLSLVRAHSGYEYQMYARELRSGFDLNQRLHVTRALAGDPSPSPLISRERDGDLVRVTVQKTSLWWFERDGRFDGGDQTAALALARSILLNIPDRGPVQWDDAGAHALLATIKALAPPVRLPSAFWNHTVLADARHHYLEGGYASALAVYARALTESLATADLLHLGRDQDLFGPEERQNFERLPDVIFRTDDKTRVMNLLLTMIDIALPGGLHVTRRTGPIDDDWRARVFGARLHQLTATLRQIRDTPVFVRACGEADREPELCVLSRTLTPVISRLVGLDVHWRDLDAAHATVPRAMADHFVAYATEVLTAVASSTYPGIARLSCARDF